MIRTCRHCGDEFDVNDPLKVRAGGFIDECPWCLEEMGGDTSAPKYLGVQAGDGKMSGVTILAFESEEDREKYASAWSQNAGQYKGKSCQMSNQNAHMGGLRFKKVGEFHGNQNHKGRE